MQYILLCTAIILEIIATTLLKTSEGFTKLLPGIRLHRLIHLLLLCILKSAPAHRPGRGVRYVVRRRHRGDNDHIRPCIRPETQHDRSHRDRPDHRRLRDPESLRHIGKLTLHLFIIKQKSMISRQAKKETRTRSLFWLWQYPDGSAVNSLFCFSYLLQRFLNCTRQTKRQ